MSTKHARKIAEASTSFKRWRVMQGLTQEEAAEQLGKSRKAIQNYEAPDPKTGRPATPDYPTRVLMAIIAQGMAFPNPWPE